MSHGYYGVVPPEYWTGDGEVLRHGGGSVAQLLGLYLLTCEYANMIGLYSLKLRAVTDELHVSRAGALKAFQTTAATQFAYYDPLHGFVWVCDMARIRMRLRDEQPLVAGDNRITGAQRLYDALPRNAFLGPFFDRYAPVLRLKGRRAWTPQDVAPQDVCFGPPSKPQGSQAEASNRSDQDQNQIRSEKAAAQKPPRTPAGTDENPEDNVGVITTIAHEVLDLYCGTVPMFASTSELTTQRREHAEQAVMGLCAERKILYNTAVVSAALDSAIVQRRVRRRA